MEISKIRFLCVLTIVSMLMFLSGHLLGSMIFNRDTTLRVNIFYQFERFSGNSQLETHNIITDKGEILTRNALAYGTLQNITMLTIGNITDLEQTDTVLDAVYDDPTDGQYIGCEPVLWQNSGDYAFNCTYKWTFEETVRLDASALYFHNTTFAYAMANFPEGAVTFTSGENLTVLWALTYNCN